MCPQGYGGPCECPLVSLFQPVPEEVGSSEPFFQAGWGLQRPCQPPQGQWMAERVVLLMPAPNASHSPALSSWFRLLRCLVEGSHAERVRGRASCSPGGWLCLGPLPRSENDGEAKPGPAACSAECQGSGEAAGTHPSPRPAQLCRCSCSRQPSRGRAGGQLLPVQSYLFLCILSQFPVPAACLSLGLSPVFPAPSLLCRDLLIPLCLVPTVTR